MSRMRKIKKMHACIQVHEMWQGDMHINRLFICRTVARGSVPVPDECEELAV